LSFALHNADAFSKSTMPHAQELAGLICSSSNRLWTQNRQWTLSGRQRCWYMRRCTWVMNGVCQGSAEHGADAS